MPDMVESAVNEFLALQLGEDEAHQTCTHHICASTSCAPTTRAPTTRAPTTYAHPPHVHPPKMHPRPPGEDEVSNAHQLLFSIAEILRSADGRGVSPDDVEKKLKLLTKGRGEINMWRKLYAPPTEHSPGTMPPLLKNASIDGKSSVIFNLPAVTYAFHIDSTLLPAAPSTEHRLHHLC